MPRILSIDYGIKRTGLAIGRRTTNYCFGLTTVPTADLFAFLRNYVISENVTTLIMNQSK
jgi:putative Holliday junction resolvase